MFRANAGCLLAGLVSAAVVLGASACGGDGPDKASAGFIAFRQPTATPTSPTEATAGPAVSTRPCGGGEWTKVKGVLICLPTGATLSMLIGDCPVAIGGASLPPCEGGMFDVITRGDSEVLIRSESGKIVKWDVAPEDEKEFRRLIREPLEAAGY